MPELEILEQNKQRLRSLKEMLHQYSAPAAEALVEHKGDDGTLQCFACGHRCVIKPGRDGVCRVRFNDNGTLLVPHGYVGALACDPIEKKPFFHVLPGSDALTFGMLGCDYHCGYCFTPDTMVLTDRGPATFADVFRMADRVDHRPDAEVALPDGLRTVAGSGNWRRVEAVFKHPYRGDLAVVRPYYLPALRCTTDHRVYATTDPMRPPEKIRARDLTCDHFLAVPRRHAFPAPSATQTIDVAALLGSHQVTHRVRWKLSTEARRFIGAATAEGRSSREIGAAIGKSGSYVRHVRAKFARGGGVDVSTGTALTSGGAVRFPHERGLGIPTSVPLNEPMARLLGFYCAEGCVVRAKDRPNSCKLNFSFSRNEVEQAEEVRQLLHQLLGVEAKFVNRTTTLAAVSGKTSAALLFKSLCGGGARHKHVPLQLLDSPRPVVEAFLAAYVAGDGHRYESGKVSITTVSNELAYGIAWLALRLGHLPSVYDTPMDEQGTIQGRSVRRAPHQYTVVWYESGSGPEITRRVVERDDFHLVPLRGVEIVQYDGDVYNMQVEEEHNYLANFLLVSNCQNWVTSQMLRDADAVAAPRMTTPAQLVDLAVKHGAPVVASSYNEPLITSEWAVDVFREARSRGLRCAYISNGNGTPQVLDFIRPHVDAYKVDLKAFSDRSYRQLGGVLENVTATIRMLKERGFWVEIVTLVVPGFSDDPDDLKRMAEFLASVDPLMPWHMTAFHPDYKMTDGYRDTCVEDLMRVVEYGRQAGLKYLYPGNLPGQVGEWENTCCHHCGATVITRYGFLVLGSRVKENGLCPDCHKPLPGIWGKSSGHGDGRVRPLL
jgi:pyruvate formate lyase activating enzyme